MELFTLIRLSARDNSAQGTERADSEVLDMLSDDFCGLSSDVSEADYPFFCWQWSWGFPPWWGCLGYYAAFLGGFTTFSTVNLIYEDHLCVIAPSRPYVIEIHLEGQLASRVAVRFVPQPFGPASGYVASSPAT